LVFDLAEPESQLGRRRKLDGNTGTCSIRVTASDTQKDDSWVYDENSLAISGDGRSDCSDFGPLLEQNQVKIRVTTDGGYTYDSLGGPRPCCPTRWTN
jgi:hypothetical protein